MFDVSRRESDAIMKPLYYRQSRTPHSEQYEVRDGDNRMGHLDLHFGNTEVYGTLVLDAEMPDDEIEQLIEQIDDDLVASADVARQDFLMRVFVGREVLWHSDDLSEDEYVDESPNGFESE